MEMVFAGGGGSAVISIRQPAQQQSTQILPLVWPVDGDGCPAAALWQRMPPGLPAASAAAALAAPKLAIRLDSAIT